MRARLRDLELLDDEVRVAQEVVAEAWACEIGGVNTVTIRSFASRADADRLIRSRRTVGPRSIF
jgi:hypothetical protein